MGRAAIKFAYGIRLKARLTVLLAALVVTEVSALIFSFAAALPPGGISPTAFDLFSAATVLLAQRWVLVDARKAVQSIWHGSQKALRGAGGQSAPDHPDWPRLSGALACAAPHPAASRAKGGRRILKVCGRLCIHEPLHTLCARG